jgi:hypothetical protein
VRFPAFCSPSRSCNIPPPRREPLGRLAGPRSRSRGCGSRKQGDGCWQARSDEMEIGTAVANAFKLAQAKYSELHEQWNGISIRIGGRLPNSRLPMSIQRDGEVDLLLRCIEDEQARADREPGIFNFHYQKMLSEYWIGGIYENFRTLRQRKLADTTPAFDQIFSDLESIRVPLEKHELPKDWSLNRATYDGSASPQQQRDGLVRVRSSRRSALPHHGRGTLSEGLRHMARGYFKNRERSLG